MLNIGIPLYICATASTTIAAALIGKGMSPGVALVFLLVGPAPTSPAFLPSVDFLGQRSTIIYLGSISICAVLLGLLLNQIYLISGIDIKMVLGKAGQVLPNYLRITSVMILVALMANSIRLRSKQIIAI